MLPSIAQWREQAFSLAGGPVFNRHAGTIPAERTRRSVSCYSMLRQAATFHLDVHWLGCWHGAGQIEDLPQGHHIADR
jgi:hypothetical protein